ncbi:conserved hypothetical protein [Desulfamplus magnetovallimortis]|uniref:YcfA family protein n=1 Tax=Desulfamplus magnetovallimortis TaxID=1246637 RepID=A0A1W1HDQ6_9BACT|nr:type II toxin-antitoxin system HicA family toxin [Desulfamplus magnetovallimortis]SLM30627.1 conserved hypothetical protein [Desulfamplus magnetovallimortis]
MKRRELLKTLESMGCVLVRHGASHDWYTNSATKQSQPVPRHREVNDNLAKSIIKKMKGAF